MADLIGAPGVIRTRDLRIRSPALYPGWATGAQDIKYYDIINLYVNGKLKYL